MKLRSFSRMVIFASIAIATLLVAQAGTSGQFNLRCTITRAVISGYESPNLVGEVLLFSLNLDTSRYSSFGWKYYRDNKELAAVDDQTIWFDSEAGVRNETVNRVTGAYTDSLRDGVIYGECVKEPYASVKPKVKF